MLLVAGHSEECSKRGNPMPSPVDINRVPVRHRISVYSISVCGFHLILEYNKAFRCRDGHIIKNEYLPKAVSVPELTPGFEVLHLFYTSSYSSIPLRLPGIIASTPPQTTRASFQPKRECSEQRFASHGITELGISLLETITTITATTRKSTIKTMTPLKIKMSNCAKSNRKRNDSTMTTTPTRN